MQEMRRERAAHLLKVVAVLIGFVVVWQAGVDVFHAPVYRLPSPGAVLQEFASDPGWYLMHSTYTIGSTLLGFGLALIVGLLASIGIVYSRLLESTLYTLLVTLNSVPK